jgi:hypothetical protein
MTAMSRPFVSKILFVNSYFARSEVEFSAPAGDKYINERPVQVMHIFGDNGQGKSTFLRIIQAFFLPDANDWNCGKHHVRTDILRHYWPGGDTSYVIFEVRNTARGIVSVLVTAEHSSQRDIVVRYAWDGPAGKIEDYLRNGLPVQAREICNDLYVLRQQRQLKRFDSAAKYSEFLEEIGIFPHRANHKLFAKAYSRFFSAEGSAPALSTETVTSLIHSLVDNTCSRQYVSLEDVRRWAKDFKDSFVSFKNYCGNCEGFKKMKALWDEAVAILKTERDILQNVASAVRGERNSAIALQSELAAEESTLVTQLDEAAAKYRSLEEPYRSNEGRRRDLEDVGAKLGGIPENPAEERDETKERGNTLQLEQNNIAEKLVCVRGAEELDRKLTGQINDLRSITPDVLGIIPTLDNMTDFAARLQVVAEENTVRLREIDARLGSTRSIETVRRELSAEEGRLVQNQKRLRTAGEVLAQEPHFNELSAQLPSLEDRLAALDLAQENHGRLSREIAAQKERQARFEAERNRKLTGMRKELAHCEEQAKTLGEVPCDGDLKDSCSLLSLANDSQDRIPCLMEAIENEEALPNPFDSSVNDLCARLSALAYDEKNHRATRRETEDVRKQVQTLGGQIRAAHDTQSTMAVAISGNEAVLERLRAELKDLEALIDLSREQSRRADLQKILIRVSNLCSRIEENLGIFEEGQMASLVGQSSALEDRGRRIKEQLGILTPRLSNLDQAAFLMGKIAGALGCASTRNAVFEKLRTLHQEVVEARRTRDSLERRCQGVREQLAGLTDGLEQLSEGLRDLESRISIRARFWTFLERSATEKPQDDLAFCQNFQDWSIPKARCNQIVHYVRNVTEESRKAESRSKDLLEELCGIYNEKFGTFQLAAADIGMIGGSLKDLAPEYEDEKSGLKKLKMLQESIRVLLENANSTFGQDVRFMQGRMDDVTYQINQTLRNLGGTTIQGVQLSFAQKPIMQALMEYLSSLQGGLFSAPPSFDFRDEAELYRSEAYTAAQELQRLLEKHSDTDKLHSRDLFALSFYITDADGKRRSVDLDKVESSQSHGNAVFALALVTSAVFRAHLSGSEKISTRGVALPIVVDEVAGLDRTNAERMADVLWRQGFFLLSASPEPIYRGELSIRQYSAIGRKVQGRKQFYLDALAMYIPKITSEAQKEGAAA